MVDNPQKVQGREVDKQVLLVLIAVLMSQIVRISSPYTWTHFDHRTCYYLASYDVHQTWWCFGGRERNVSRRIRKVKAQGFVGIQKVNALVFEGIQEVAAQGFVGILRVKARGFVGTRKMEAGLVIHSIG